MNQFKKYENNALGQLDILREFYEMDDDNLDAGVLEASILHMEEEHEILQDGLPQAIEEEIKWSKDNKESYNISKDYYEGYIKGLEQAGILFEALKQIN
jgi:hypothetical protein